VLQGLVHGESLVGAQGHEGADQVLGARGHAGPLDAGQAVLCAQDLKQAMIEIQMTVMSFNPVDNERFVGENGR
jgi:hypothetical protein